MDKRKIMPTLLATKHVCVLVPSPNLCHGACPQLSLLVRNSETPSKDGETNGLRVISMGMNGCQWLQLIMVAVVGKPF